MLSDFCKTCRRTFGQQAWVGKDELLKRDPEFPNYCTQGCAAVVRKWRESVHDTNYHLVMNYVNSGEVKSTLISRAFDLSQEESKKEFAEFIANFLADVNVYAVK